MGSDRYRRRMKLGEGQMSVVWLALDTYTQQPVALKIMTGIPEDDQRNQKARERFHREIEIARTLQHPHILPIIDYGYMEYEQRRTPYLVSPYIKDGSLAEIFKTRAPWQSWSLPQIADALLQAGESLWYLHTRPQPIVHEDVKPGNFLCRLEERPERMVHLYLSDFGISRWQQGSADMTSELLGTFQFMAPEQFERKVDLASDQYALAVMACFMLTGKLPIQAATHDLYPDAHKHEQPLPPSVLNPQRVQSQSIDEVILRALEKHPARRYPSIIEFARTLHQAIIHYAREQAAAPTVQEQDVAQLDTVVAYKGELAKNEVPLFPVHKEALSPLPERSFVANFSDFSISLDPPDTQEEHELDEPLPAKPVKIVASSTRSDELLFTPLSLSDPVRLLLPARPRSLAWSPDGSGLAAVLYGQAPVVVRGNGTVQDILTPYAEQVTGLCWSPDSAVIAVAARGELRFWDVAARAPLPLVLNFNVRALDALAWSNGNQLAIWLADQILIYTLSPARLRSSAPLTPQRIATGGMRCAGGNALRWSLDGSLLAAGAANGSIRCWSAMQPQAPWQVVSAGPKVNALAWSPAALRLVAAFRDNRIAAWDAHTRQEILCWKNLPAMPRMLDITTTGRIVFASGERRLLLGSFDAVYPTHVLPGQLLVACSPRMPELATLDEQREQVMMIWRE